MYEGCIAGGGGIDVPGAGGGAMGLLPFHIAYAKTLNPHFDGKNPMREKIREEIERLRMNIRGNNEIWG